MSTQALKAKNWVAEDKKKILKVGLCGNPNSGKSCIFNELTGGNQHVGNWAGVTVEKKIGHANFGPYQIEFVDLPGTYSLTAYSMEEIVARDYIIKERPDVVVNVVDSTNLDRNLYLTTQLIELGARAVIALNMSDEAEHKGLSVDKELLAKLLGMPVVSMVGNRGIGFQELLKEIVAVAEKEEPVSRHLHINYGIEVEEEIRKIQAEMRKDPALTAAYSTRWLSVKLLEHDGSIKEHIQKTSANAQGILEQLEKSHKHIETILHEESEILLADRRYGFIKGLLLEVFHEKAAGRRSLSDKIDKIVTNRLLGIPILVGFLWLMFQTTFKLGAYPMDWIDSGVGLLATFLNGVMPEGLLKALVVDGIVSGVGGVLVFLPNILILFFFISLFEDTGYMARAAFIMDRIMHTLGLHGKSFIPMVMGFGCNVPAIMAARALENKSDRMLTILINPLVSCSARLPVYILLAGAFFPQQAGNLIFGIYVTGLVLAILVGQLFRRTIFKGETAPFVMELPPYRWPLFKSVMIHMWEKGSVFVRKVGGTILAASVIIWFLSAFPRNVDYSMDFDRAIAQTKTRYEAKIATSVGAAQKRKSAEAMMAEVSGIKARKEKERVSKSYAGHLGQWIEPVIRPLGFDWRGGIALITGIAAKEIVVSTFGVLYQVGGDAAADSEGLREALRKEMTPLSALAFMFFTLIYIPCIGTLGVMYRELGSLKWTLFAVGYSLGLAWVVAFLIFQGGRFLGFGT